MATLILAAIVLGCLALGVRLLFVEAPETWATRITGGSAMVLVAVAGLRGTCMLDPWNPFR